MAIAQLDTMITSLNEEISFCTNCGAIVEIIDSFPETCPKCQIELGIGDEILIHQNDSDLVEC